ncbi:LETM1 domain-containing protein 1 isoform X2 [Agrilus planipennis]|uniref:LETM1 domain-containing protein 1 isoform X2 n=1 Tax=Agrilus planipennis TaxID=224129 RepID=A0A7F5RAQ2_AGRPL|nr:LETM1 domain-containing protein 1 isoform X2 [Agrilus planipennis]
MALPILIPAYRRNISKILLTYTAKRQSQTSGKRSSPVYKSEKAKTKIRFYLLDQYSYYLDKYEKILEKQLPGAMKIYRIFMEGIKHFFRDFKEFIKIYREVNFSTRDIRTLELNQLELYDQMPRDMLKIAPVLLISALPLANYVIFPLAFYFPRQLLTHHFWDLKQKSEFRIYFLRKRLLHNRPIFRHLQTQLPNLRSHDLHKQWSHVLGQIGSGVHPTACEILECKDLFEGEPYHIYYISGNHVRHLIKLHDLHAGFLKRSRLVEQAALIQAMDKAIMKQGGVDELGMESLRTACFTRGIFMFIFLFCNAFKSSLLYRKI